MRVQPVRPEAGHLHDPADPVFDAERFLVIDDVLLDENNREQAS